MAELARDEEAWWQAEAGPAGAADSVAGTAGARRGPGGGDGDRLSMDVTRLAALAPAVQRRLLRHAAEQLGAALDFPATEALRTLALDGPRRTEDWSWPRGCGPSELLASCG